MQNPKSPPIPTAELLFSRRANGFRVRFPLLPPKLKANSINDPSKEEEDERSLGMGMRILKIDRQTLVEERT
nr:hypothetical protein Iba_chr10fCG1260 [Ipomoea batatas]